LLGKRDRELHSQDIIIQDFRNVSNDKDIRIQELSRIVHEKTQELSNYNVLYEESKSEHDEIIRQITRENEIKLESMFDIQRHQLEDFEKQRGDLYIKIKAAEYETSIQK
jgi:hypothetical protein